jgi:hypothetical protein
VKPGSPENLMSTAELPAVPPLNKRARMKVPPADLDWFELSDVARALAARIDGTRTLFEILESTPIADSLAAVAELHDHGLLAYDD